MNNLQKNIPAESSSVNPNFLFLQRFIAYLFSKRVKKKEFILRAGEVCDHMIFVKKGLLRVYIEHEGREFNTWFVKEDEFVVSMNSYYYGIPSPEYIQALEDSEVMLVKKNVYHTLLKANHKLSLFAINQMCLSLCEYQMQCRTLRFMPADKRYEFLNINKPDIISRLSQKHIASFIGVETTYLSKIVAAFKSDIKPTEE